MSGRCAQFSPEDQARFTETVVRHLRELAGPHAAVAHQPRADEYHQVRTQMPGTTHCGRYATLYLFADLMGIPYAQWHQERFNRVLPTFMQVFENRPGR
jgi:hypothetical protein